MKELIFTSIGFVIGILFCIALVWFYGRDDNDDNDTMFNH